MSTSVKKRRAARCGPHKMGASMRRAQKATVRAIPPKTSWAQFLAKLRG